MRSLLLRAFVPGLLALLFLPCAPLEAQSFRDAKKRLIQGLEKRDFGLATGAVDDLIALGSEKGLDAVVSVGLAGDYYGLERYIAGKLVAVPKGEGLDHLCSLAAEAKAAPVRVLLTLVLGSRPEPEAFAAVIENINDRDDSVALAALEKVSQKDSGRAIGPLIAALARREKKGEQEGLVAFEVQKVLTQLTREELETARDWEQWWEPREGSFVRPPERPAIERSGTGVSRTTSKFFNIEVPADRVVFLLDISGSMEERDPAPEETGAGGDGDGTGGRGGTGVSPPGGRAAPPPSKPDPSQIPESRMRLRRVQKELIETIQRLPERTEFNIILFNHQIQGFSEELLRANSRNKRDAIDFVQRFEAAGETWTDHALQRAFETDRLRAIFLLSDGQPRRNEVKLPHEPILEWIQEANRFSRVRIHTIGFEQAGATMRKFMKAIAKQNHGEYVELR